MTAVAFLDHPDVLTAIGEEALPVSGPAAAQAGCSLATVIAIEGPTTLTCDVLVIGTGAGGASAAATLADAGVDVLMLEEGPYVPPPMSRPRACRKRFHCCGAAVG